MKNVYKPLVRKLIKEGHNPREVIKALWECERKFETAKIEIYVPILLEREMREYLSGNKGQVSAV